MSGKSASSYIKRAFMIVENIAFLISMDKELEHKVLRAVDLNDTGKTADFTIQDDDYVLKESTFSENGKRWYEALYIMERNRKTIHKAYAGEAV